MILDGIVDRLQATGYWIHDICALALCNGYKFRIQDTRSFLQEYESGSHKEYMIPDKHNIKDTLYKNTGSERYSV
jgi:hypothetical protein